MAVVVALGVVVVLRREPAIVEVELTLITSDRSDVACASSKMAGAYACGFGDDGAPRGLDEGHTLRPYMTRDRRVYLIPGLFLETNISNRYKSEPPHVPREQLRRFTAKCKLDKSGQLEGFKLRWATQGAWSEPQTADIAKVSTCGISD